MSDNTHQELDANMARWREQLAAARNVADQSLQNCEGMSVPARYNLLASAVREIRGLVRPEPRTAGFLEEKSWYESTSPHFKDVLRREGILPPADLPPVNLPAGADGTEPGDGVPVQFQSSPPVNIPPRVHEQLEYWEEQLVQLMAMRRYCVRGDADLDALDCAIRALEKRHRNRVRHAVRHSAKAASEEAAQ